MTIAYTHTHYELKPELAQLKFHSNLSPSFCFSVATYSLTAMVTMVVVLSVFFFLLKFMFLDFFFGCYCQIHVKITPCTLVWIVLNKFLFVKHQAFLICFFGNENTNLNTTDIKIMARISCSKYTKHKSRRIFTGKKNSSFTMKIERRTGANS